MTTPAYHLRTNKAIERLLFIESLRHLVEPAKASNYTYYGFGGPFLDDFRLIHENFPLMSMVSLEREGEVFKRQEFHLPNGKIKLRKCEFSDFLSEFNPDEKPCIIWLDYTKLRYGSFEDFMQLLPMLPDGSIVKITLRAEHTDYQSKDKKQLFMDWFSKVIPAGVKSPPFGFENFCLLLQDMLQIASQRAFFDASDVSFQPISTFCYKDRAGIMTLTGQICSKERKVESIRRFKGWRYSNLYWKKKPLKIEVPYLSTKERLYLQSLMPCESAPVRTIKKALGYTIHEDAAVSSLQLKQYSEFYGQYPHFIRAFL